MKILMISPQIPYPYIGGAKMVTYNTIKYLSKNKVDITLLALGRNDGESSNALKKYCNLKIVPFKTNNNYLLIGDHFDGSFLVKDLLNGDSNNSFLKIFNT